MPSQSSVSYWLKNAAYLSGVPVYAAIMRALAARAGSDEARLALTRRVKLRSYALHASQVDSEILGLLRELRNRRCRRVVEIGTARGGTLFLLLQALPRDASVVTIDLPAGPVGAGYPHWKTALFHALRPVGQRLTLIRGDSQDPATQNRVREALGGSADFILIDGDHSYEGARRDFELYMKILAPAGVIAFHDIVPGPSENVGGVPKLWQELRERYVHRELVADWRQGGFGIGLLYVDAAPPSRS
jgi:predicted O-methyltransferase YrrM